MEYTVEDRNITRRLDTVLNGLNSEFKVICGKGDFERKLIALKNAGTMSDRPSKLCDLYELFDKCGFQYEKGRSNDYYEKLIESLDLPTPFETEEKMLAALKRDYRQYPSPAEYMRRLVDRQEDARDGWAQDTLRLRILKQFIKYGDYLTDAGYASRKTIEKYVKTKANVDITAENVLRYLDDGIFDILDGASSDQKKPTRKYGLLKAADDLAAGKFHGEGATQKSLYMFAMVYDMTYCTGNAETGVALDVTTDIEKNLFRDYYTNNLMRYISASFRDNPYDYELDPSGRGINYKNFAEVIYLYYISSGFAPAEKVRLSGEMIARVKESQYHKEVRFGAAENRTRKLMKMVRSDAPDALYSEDILRMNPDAFEKFVCDNFDCDTYAGEFTRAGQLRDRQTGILQLEAEQNSAFAEYRDIINSLKELDTPIEECKYGLWFTDVEEYRDGLYSQKNGEAVEFIALLEGTNGYLTRAALEGVTPGTITRTKLLAVYYYYYNALHEKDDKYKWMCFDELFGNFKIGIDKHFQKANYMELSGKNLLDVLIAFSSYAYLNM